DRGLQKRDFGPPYLILSFSSTSNTQILPNFITLTPTNHLISLNPTIPTTKFLYFRNPCKIFFDSNRLISQNNASSQETHQEVKRSIIFNGATPSRSSLGSMVLQQGGFQPLSFGFCIKESGSSKVLRT
ncbi:hypothetical protein PIB30_055524, partial [Stylosanthes scabra]|nr:hypothetical protein [Stylosanthes scabra]